MMPITISTTVSAPIETVWELWTLPEHIMNWNFASPDWHCPKVINDIQPGGKLNWTMSARDGSISFDFEGTYDVIVTHERIIYTIADGRKVEIMFEVVAQGVRVTEIFEPETENTIELQKSGWQTILDNFKKYVES